MRFLSGSAGPAGSVVPEVPRSTILPFSNPPTRTIYLQKFGFIKGCDNVNWPPYREVVLLPHRRSTTVSLETIPFIYLLTLCLQSVDKCNEADFRQSHTTHANVNVGHGIVTQCGTQSLWCGGSPHGRCTLQIY